MYQSYFREQFNRAETAILGRFFSNTDGPVFALVNLPEVVKGALFARYSRSHKSLRRLFLDEFYENPDVGLEALAAQVPSEDESIKLQRAERLYDRVFSDYGDDSVAQLGGAHLACEQASNILTKVLEWGRLASYLEQSTRYIYYDRPLGERFRYFTPPELEDSKVKKQFVTYMDLLFRTYSDLVRKLFEHYAKEFPKSQRDAPAVWRATIRAMACDTARGLLPAATKSNVGIFGTGQAYEALLLRMRASPLGEVRDYSTLMLTELRKVIPAFLRRVDRPERGVIWSKYLSETASATEQIAAQLEYSPQNTPEVTLVDWDPDAELKIAAAALYSSSNLPDDQLLGIARTMSALERSRIIKAYIGQRMNRRHRPGRAMERSFYRFDIVLDFGSFRDLQRHRMLTIEWQRFGTSLGYNIPDGIREIGATEIWNEAMSRAAEVHSSLTKTVGANVAQYAVPFGYKIRFVMQMNARQAFHLLELRSARQGHSDYRRVSQHMHRLIRDKAGHKTLAACMEFVDHEQYRLSRLESERKLETRRGSSDVRPSAEPN